MSLTVGIVALMLRPQGRLGAVHDVAWRRCRILFRNCDSSPLRGRLNGHLVLLRLEVKGRRREVDRSVL